jgi:hypothetical protein
MTHGIPDRHSVDQEPIEIPPFPAEPSRYRLGFADAVRSNFQFLLTEFGFSITEEDATLVRFESDRTVVNVFHGRSSYELGVEFGLRVPKEQREFRYSLRTVLSLLDTASTSGYKDLQTSSAELLPGFVASLAELTRQFAPDMLRGDPEVFERLRYHSWLEGRKTTDYYSACSLREIAEKAWKDGDFARVVEAYTKVKALETAELTPSEVLRLRKARWELDDTRAKLTNS